MGKPIAPGGSTRVVVVMGVSGAGKSTVGTALASRLGWRFADADAFHPAANVAKMSSGRQLTDEDRWPWLGAIAAWIDDRRARGEPAVVTCSALKRAYREILIGSRPDVALVLLDGTRELLTARLTARKGHFMPASLLDGQLTILERPGPDERPILVDIAAAPEVIVADICKALDRA